MRRCLIVGGAEVVAEVTRRFRAVRSARPTPGAAPTIVNTKENDAQPEQHGENGFEVLLEGALDPGNHG